jgi:hypothetical protein
MWLPPIRCVIQYISGAGIYLSGIEPLAYDTLEIQRLNIDVVISLLEEIETPQFIRKAIPGLKHSYYRVKDDSEQSLYRLFDPVFNRIHRSLEEGKNVLIHCRNGESVCVAMLIGFFILCIRWGERYLIFDYVNFLPKCCHTWTDSFLYFIRLMYPPANPRIEFIRELYEFEEEVLKPLRDEVTNEST